VGAGHVLISDFWIFHTDTTIWTKLQLTGAQISGRCGARAVFHSGSLFVYGGISRKCYCSELYRVDVETGVTIIVEATGAIPQGRTAPLLTAHGNCLYVWGGHNGKFLTDLSVLNLDTLVWNAFPQDVHGHVPSDGVLYGDRYYTFGAKEGELMAIDFESKTVECIETGGSEIPPPIVGAGMVMVEKYLFLFGGNSSSQWTFMYVCDLERNWWFQFPLSPDSTTTSFEDGRINNLGLFQVPRLHYFCMCYIPERREIISFMGHPRIDPPPFHTIAIGEALSVLHLGEDLMFVQ
jgi:hypothetical protein